MERLFDKFGDWVEYLFSTWFGFLSYLACSVATFLLWGWDGIDRFTYLTNGLLVILLINGNRRSLKAAHAKLDAIDPDDDHNHLEDKLEREIDQARIS